LLASDPPYGVQLDQTWRDGVYNGPRKRVKGWGVVAGAAKPYMMRELDEGQAEPEPAPKAKRGHHTTGHRNTSISMDVRADWSEAYALVPSLQVGYVWYASIHSLEVLSGLLRSALAAIPPAADADRPIRRDRTPGLRPGPCARNQPSDLGGIPLARSDRARSALSLRCRLGNGGRGRIWGGRVTFNARVVDRRSLPGLGVACEPGRVLVPVKFVRRARGRSTSIVHRRSLAPR
jgi:hypothetical protein